MSSKDKAHLTAISRKSLSAPIKHFQDYLRHRHRDQQGSILHHGCGRAEKDNEFLHSLCPLHYDVFDPTFAPNRSVLLNKYDTVVSNFVLNVLEPEDRQEAWMDIMMCVKDTGMALITVRSDKDTSIKGQPHEDGVVTGRGTFQKGYSLEDLETEAEGFFHEVYITSHGHYRTAQCFGPKN